MRRFAKAVLCSAIGSLAFLALGGEVRANTIQVFLDSVTGSPGNVTYTYRAELTGNSQVQTGDFFTVYDFDGFIAGTQNSSGGFNPTLTSQSGTQLLGINAVLTAPNDDATVPNLTWQYTGSTITTNGVLGLFSARSIYNTATLDNYTSEDHQFNTTLNTYVPAGNVSTVTVPAERGGQTFPLPLPAAAWAGMGLFGLISGSRLRKRASLT